MLEAILVILVILWALGFLIVHIPGLLHLLFVILIVVVIYRLITKRRV